MIYTSGSTGQPKGVVVEHRQAINFLHGMARHWQVGPGAAVLSFAAFTFDVSVMDMFMPLLGGAKVVLAPPSTLHSPPRLAALLREARITFACLPPAVLSLLTGEQFPELRTLLSAGEELTSELLRAWLRPGLEIYNGYGPTECSIGVHVHEARRQHAAAATDRPAQAQLPGLRARRRTSTRCPSA